MGESPLTLVPAVRFAVAALFALGVAARVLPAPPALPPADDWSDPSTTV